MTVRKERGREGEKGERTRKEERNDDIVVTPDEIVFAWVIRQATRGKLKLTEGYLGLMVSNGTYIYIIWDNCTHCTLSNLGRVPFNVIHCTFNVVQCQPMHTHQDSMLIH